MLEVWMPCHSCEAYRLASPQLSTHVSTHRLVDTPQYRRGQRKQSLKDKNRFFEIARGSALECAAIHDILISFEAIDLELNRVGQTNLKRIVSMLTRLIQRTDSVSEGSIEYEYEYRDAEYEYEKKHEPSDARKSPDTPRF